jgi:hypothetical protein
MRYSIFVLALALAGCRTMPPMQPSGSLDAVGERFVKLTLAIGQHDSDYVDAYYGPPEWREAAKAGKVPLAELAQDAKHLEDDLAALVVAQDEMTSLRKRALTASIRAMRAKLAMLTGTKFNFNEESRLLYDAQAPSNPESYYQSLLDQLSRDLPGDGTVSERLEAFRRDFVIPAERLDAVFRTAVEGCRERTLRHVELPAGESFTIEYVTNKSWSGYNWYQGNYKSLIQVNTDLPIYIDRAIDLACHEGYPGHHVYNVLLEKNLVRDRGWVEYSVYPLFSPQSLIAEGSANYGIDVAFPQSERIAYERDVLFPAAGLDPARVEEYYRVQNLAGRLSHAGNEAARRYLDGEIDAASAAEWLSKYALFSPERAKQRVRFIEQYRSYVINYNYGRDLVRAYVESRAGGDARRRWEIFEEILSRPTIPSEIAAASR